MNEVIPIEQQNQQMELSQQHRSIGMVVKDEVTSENILHILNDDCIQAILLKLENILDFLNASEVCTNFQKNAQICFPYKNITLFDYHLDRPTYENIIFMEYAKNLLSIFGSFVKGIRYVAYKTEQLFNNIYYSEKVVIEHINLIHKYCGKTLNKLKIKGSHIKPISLGIEFPALEELELEGFLVTSSKLFPKLKKMCLENVSMSDFHWIVAEFPRLKEVEFRDSSHLDDETFIKFQNLNPQLEKLFYGHATSNELTSVAWRDIGERLPNIVSLSFFVPKAVKMDEIMLEFGKLRKLRELTLIDRKTISLKPLLDSFIENNTPIEKLELSYLHTETAERIHKLNRLKKLKITNTPVEIILNIIKKLPTLEYLELFFIKGGNLWMVKQILQQCRNLNRLRVIQLQILIDVNEFNSVVELAKNRTKVSLEVYRIVQNGILDMYNNGWVVIQHYRYHLGYLKGKPRHVFVTGPMPASY